MNCVNSGLNYVDNVLPTGCESALGPTRGRRIQASGVYLLYLGMGYDILCIRAVYTQ